MKAEIEDPTVSVVIPCHNYARFVGSCIESVLGQDTQAGAVEIIAIDDASTDDSWAVLQRYRDVPALRSFREERNRGYVAVYRRGMAEARGRYLLPLDADDLIVATDALRTQLAIADANPRVGFVHSDTREIDEGGRTLRDRRSWQGSGIVPSHAAFARLLMGNSVQHTGTLIRRAAYEQAGGYDPTILNAIDWDLWLRITRDWDVGYVPRPLYAYRLHSSNMHQRVARDEAINRAVRDEVFMLVKRETAHVSPALRRGALARAHLVMANALLADAQLREGVGHVREAVVTRPAVITERLLWLCLARGPAVALLGRDRVAALAARLRAMWASEGTRKRFQRRP